jgi:hypothetical protein
MDRWTECIVVSTGWREMAVLSAVTAALLVAGSRGNGGFA